MIWYVAMKQQFMAREPERLKVAEGALRLTQGTSRYHVLPQGTSILPQGTSIFKVPSIWRHLRGTCRCSRYLQVHQGTSRYNQNEGTLKIKVPSVKRQFLSRYLESRYLRTEVHWGGLRYFEVLIAPWGTLKLMYLEVPWENSASRYLLCTLRYLGYMSCQGTLRT